MRTKLIHHTSFLPPEAADQSRRRQRQQHVRQSQTDLMHFYGCFECNKAATSSIEIGENSFSLIER